MNSSSITGLSGAAGEASAEAAAMEKDEPAEEGTVFLCISLMGFLQLPYLNGISCCGADIAVNLSDAIVSSPPSSGSPPLSLTRNSVPPVCHRLIHGLHNNGRIHLIRISYRIRTWLNKQRHQIISSAMIIDYSHANKKKFPKQKFVVRVLSRHSWLVCRVSPEGSFVN